MFSISIGHWMNKCIYLSKSTNFTFKICALNIPLILIHGFSIFKFTYLLKFLCIPTRVLVVLSVSFTDLCMYTLLQNLNNPMDKFPAKVEKGKHLPSCFSSHPVIKCSFHCIFSAMFLHYCWFLLFKVVPKYSGEVLVSVPKCKKGCDVFYKENTCIWIKFFQMQVVMLLTVSSMLMNQSYALNKKLYNFKWKYT